MHSISPFPNIVHVSLVRIMVNLHLTNSAAD